MYGGWSMPSRSNETEPSTGRTAVRSSEQSVTSVPMSSPRTRPCPRSRARSRSRPPRSPSGPSRRAPRGRTTPAPRARASSCSALAEAPRGEGQNLDQRIFPHLGQVEAREGLLLQHFGTASPSSVRSTASTTRSIWVTPRRVRPSSSRAVLSPWGTHPATTRALFRARPSRITVFIALCDGFFTVHVLTTHASANAGSGSSRYPYAWSWPAMNSESLWLCEHPNVFTCTLAVPGTRGPGI